MIAISFIFFLAFWTIILLGKVLKKGMKLCLENKSNQPGNSLTREINSFSPAFSPESFT